MPHLGQVPGSADVTSGCIGQAYELGASSERTGSNCIPHFGQVPGSDDVTSGCIGQA